MVQEMVALGIAELEFGFRYFPALVFPVLIVRVLRRAVLIEPARGQNDYRIMLKNKWRKMNQNATLTGIICPGRYGVKKRVEEYSEKARRVPGFLSRAREVSSPLRR